MFSGALIPGLIFVLVFGYVGYRMWLDHRVREFNKPVRVQLYPKKEKLKKWRVFYDLKDRTGDQVEFTEYYHLRVMARFNAWRTWRIFYGGTITLSRNRRA